MLRNHGIAATLASVGSQFIHFSGLENSNRCAIALHNKRVHCLKRVLCQKSSESNFDHPPMNATELPTQGDSVVVGIDPIDYINKQLQDILKPPSTEDYLAVRERETRFCRFFVRFFKQTFLSTV